MVEQFSLVKEVFDQDLVFEDTRDTIQSNQNITLKSKVDVDRALKQMGIQSIWTDKSEAINKAIATKSVSKSQGIKLLATLTE